MDQKVFNDMRNIYSAMCFQTYNNILLLYNIKHYTVGRKYKQQTE